MEATTIAKEECDYCDGCGWYEGGPALRNHCEKCNGKGYIEVKKEPEVHHKWSMGVWGRKDAGDKHITREDSCNLCGCKRTLVKHRVSDTGIIACYSRSHQIFGANNMPSCWGDKQP